ncbi:MAG: aldehyde dehydrogenase family protein [Anaerolineaceae bacterium]|nr:aldehyde dehydrogenase family protein [Anaerolineaceae bacterium]
MKSILEKLDIHENNRGSCFGTDGWISNDDGSLIVSTNPTNGEIIGAVETASSKSYEHILSEASTSFVNWREKPAPQRGQLIRDLGNALRENLEPLGELISLEMGKISPEGIGEVQEMIDICDFAVGLSRQLYGLTMHSERPGHRMYEQWHPIGPVGVITAFNFPGAPWAWNAAIAAVCGDTIVWKPSEITPLTAVAIQKITNRVMTDHETNGVFNLLVGDGPSIGQTLVQDKRIPLISFTGSIATGRKVSEQVASRLGQSILELGGNNAIIVTEDADIDLTVQAVLFGAVGTTGQRCTTTRRLIAHSSIIDELINRVIEAYANVPIGNPLDKNVLMGPMINEEAVNRMFKAVQRAQDSGGTLLYGGKRLPKLGPLFVEPAIIRMSEQTPLVCEETFAPILYIMDYEKLDDAINMHNSVPQGLSSAIFTRNINTAEKFLSVGGSDCGIANVNIGTSGAEIGGAFGGEKDTGGGRESGSDAWKGYMRRQTVTINWTNNLPLSQGIKFTEKEKS